MHFRGKLTWRCQYFANSKGLDIPLIVQRFHNCPQSENEFVDLQEFDQMFTVSNSRTAKPGLKLSEFIYIMRVALGLEGGSDPADLTDKAL